MALFGKRDAKVPLLTRVCQVEDDEISALMWQVEHGRMDIDVYHSKEPELIKSDLLVRLIQMKIGYSQAKNQVRYEWMKQPPAELLTEYDAEIRTFKRLRNLTSSVMESIADAPEGMMNYESWRTGDAPLLPDLFTLLNEQVGKLTPFLYYFAPIEMEGEEVAQWHRNAMEEKRIPRDSIIIGYGEKDPCLQSNYYIRKDLMELLGKNHTQSVNWCPVCGFPFLLTRKNQQMCSARDRARRAKKAQTTKKKEFRVADLIENTQTCAII